MSRFNSQGTVNQDWAQKSRKTNQDFKDAAAGKEPLTAARETKGDVAKTSLDREPSIADKKAGAAFDDASRPKGLVKPARKRPERARGRSNQRGRGMSLG